MPALLVLTAAGVLSAHQQVMQMFLAFDSSPDADKFLMRLATSSTIVKAFNDAISEPGMAFLVLLQVVSQVCIPICFTAADLLMVHGMSVADVHIQVLISIAVFGLL